MNWYEGRYRDIIDNMDVKVFEKYIERARPVLEALEKNGHKALLVGGCVREALRGNEDRTDLDVTTGASPQEVKEVFRQWHVIDTGIKHGTVTVMMPVEEGGEKIPVEVTTFRSDGDYSDGRHPDEIRFVGSVEEDLARRDFTINSMAVGLDGELIDPFGGREDLKKGLIRAVGDPNVRFREDGLRIMRALRFASVLDFEIEKDTADALLLHKDLLKQISPERIFVELKKTLAGKSAGRVVREFTDVFSVVIPELEDIRGFHQRNSYHRYDVLEHCIRAMEAVETTPENREYMKLMALLHDVGKPSTFTLDEDGIGHFYGHAGEGDRICRAILQRLRSDGFTRDRICYLVHYHDLVFEEDDRLLKRWMSRHGTEVLLEILDFKKADNIATGNVTEELLDKFNRIKRRIMEIEKEGDCLRVKDLAVNGKDLMDAGVAPGPAMGGVLEKLLYAVLDGKVENDRAKLLEYLDRPEP